MIGALDIDEINELSEFKIGFFNIPNIQVFQEKNNRSFPIKTVFELLEDRWHVPT